jgi:hypothetical protein
MEKAIIHIKVQYDAVNGRLRFVVPAFEALLDADAIYDLNVPVEMREESEIEEFIATENPVVAHA